MSDPASIRDWIAAAGEQAEVESIAYADRLSRLRLANLLTVLLPALFATAAAVVAADPIQPTYEFLVPLTLPSILSALAALLITMHKTLKCDEVQAECLRLSKAFGALAVSAKAALAVADNRLTDEHCRLSIRLELLIDGAKITLPDRYVHRARAKLSRQRSRV